MELLITEGTRWNFWLKREHSGVSDYRGYVMELLVKEGTYVIVKFLAKEET